MTINISLEELTNIEIEELINIEIELEELTNIEIAELTYDVTDVYRLLAEHIKHRIYHDDFKIEHTDKEHVTLIFD